MMPHSDASAFVAAAPALLASGFSPIPIVPGDKIPGIITDGQWRFHKGWNQYCAKQPGSFQVGVWSKWERAGVGAALGRGLLAVDIDRDDLVDPVLAVLPPVVVAKRGRKGLTVFYRGDTDALRSRGFKIDGHGVLDFLSHGKQTVLPPSLHPSGIYYEWTTHRTLLDTRIADLPEFTAAHFEALLAVLVEFGWQQEAHSEAASAGPIESDTNVTDFFRRLNEDALANLDAWVPALGLAQRPLRAPDGTYRAVAEWRPSSSGKPLRSRSRNLSFDRRGIKDFGDGDKTYTALNVVLAAHELSSAQLNQAAVWLGEKLGYDFSPKIVLTSKPKPAPEPVASPPAAAIEIERRPALTAPKTVPAPPVAAPEPIILPSLPAGDRMARLNELSTNVPGIVGDLMAWINGSTKTPVKPLALAASLTFLGTVAGRKYKGPTGLLTNLYTLGLADSGFGKDHARDCIKNLCAQAGLMRLLGGSKIMSGSAIRTKLEAEPSSLWMLDEFAGFITDITSPRAGPHVQQIRYFLLELYSAAKTAFLGADYAGNAASPILNPNACLYGTSTPVDFWQSMSSRGVADGFLPRFLVVPVSGPRPEKIRPVFDVEVVPDDLREGVRSLLVQRGGGNLSGRTTDGSTALDPVRVRWGDGGEAAFERLQAACEKAHDRARPEARAIWTRVAENAVKIAAIGAIGTDPDAPEIGEWWMEWAGELVTICAESTIEEIAGRLADNDRQREHLDVKRWIMEAGPKGLTRTMLSKRVNGRFNAKRMDEICGSLDQDEKVITLMLGKASAKGGKAPARYVARKFLSDEAEDE